jgi:flavin-dependent dehydrogenase
MIASRSQKKYSVEVLVVGAGPAGIAAAETLARSGAKTALIERRSRPGSKACAGALTPEAWPAAGIDPNRPDSRSQAFRAITVRTGLGSFSLRDNNFPLLATIDRGAWTAERLDTLRDLGVEVSLGERLVHLSKSSVATSAGARSFGFLVAADGASSRVRSLLGLDRSLAMRAWQIRISASLARKSGLDTEAPTIWFDPKRVGSGYCWAFPYFEEMRVGLGASLRALDSKTLKKSFFAWLGELGLDRSSGPVQTGAIGCGYLGHRFGRVFLAGDAAGLASPLTGEGISQALISGREAAREIVDPGYRSSAIAELAGRHRRTHDVLLHPSIRRPLYFLAPGLLGIPFIRNAALSKYVKKTVENRLLFENCFNQY